MKNRIISLLIALVCVPSAWLEAETRIVVAADGSGDYTTVGEALRKVRGDFDEPVTIFIKNGTYREKLLINATVNNLTIEGENPDGCIITWDDYAALRNMGTSGSYTCKVEGNNVTFRNLTIENGAGPVGQAVAMHTIGDRISFINCRFLGNQDTLYTGGRNARLYFEDCYIEGTVDFIFGAATALFNRCRLHGKADGYFTAASTAAETPVGYVFYKCRLTTEPDAKMHLGRPWRPYASTYFVECDMEGNIQPQGWNNWGNKDNESTARYGEYKSTGSGASPATRVTWSKVLTDEEAARLTDPGYIFTRTMEWRPF
ncbi:MAG: pectin esterase [Duncaniella sp.]|nr:pectin esterase [Duncaniella sp.]